MTVANGAAEIVLVVDDEESVRKTVRDWLADAGLGVQVLTAADSESALLLANDHVIDLAILDWNLGAGLNGLDLLQDLAEFQPNIIAIMMTAYADQATPLDAMRRGVRDYLDKNQEFSRDVFLAAVNRQLQFIRPAKRERQFHQNLLEFRNAVERALPVVESLAALRDPVSLPDAISALFRFLLTATHASDGVLFVRHWDAHKEPQETCRVYDAAGQALDAELTTFPQSIAASAVSLEEPCAMTDLDKVEKAQSVILQPFEKGRYSLLAAPLAVAPGIHVVLELFDKRDDRGVNEAEGFSASDIRLVRDAGEFGADILRQNLAQRQTHQILLDAVEAALKAGESVSQSLEAGESTQQQQGNPVLDHLREQLGGGGAIDSGDSVRLAEAIRDLSSRHGEAALRHCIRLVESLTETLDEVTGV